MQQKGEDPTRFPFFPPLSISLSHGNTTLIIARLQRPNRWVESRAAAAEAVWENPSCLLQPCACVCVFVGIQSILSKKKQTERRSTTEQQLQG